MTTIKMKVAGVDRFASEIDKAAQTAPRALETVVDAVAHNTARAARTSVPVRRGDAAASIRVTGSAHRARVVAGGPRAPYFGWLDYGGAVGRRGATQRPYRPGGRYIYRALHAELADNVTITERALVTCLEQAGLDVG